MKDSAEGFILQRKDMSDLSPSFHPHFLRDITSRASLYGGGSAVLGKSGALTELRAWARSLRPLKGLGFVEQCQEKKAEKMLLTDLIGMFPLDLWLKTGLLLQRFL